MHPPPGWYRDPEKPGPQLRYWDGTQWTDHPLTQGSPGAPPNRRPSWIERHKALATFVVAGLVFYGIARTTDGPDERADDTHSTVGSRGPGAGSDESGRDTATDDGWRAGKRPEGRGTKPEGRATKPDRKPGRSKNAFRTYLVVDVVDGDTIHLRNGETVRLVGIDTPEAGECGADRATAYLQRLVLGERARLGISDEDRDGYGRLLRYVDVGNVDTGLRLIQEGLAVARYDSRDGYGYHPREDQYIAADRASPNLGCPKPAPLVAPPGRACAPGYRPCVPAYPPDMDCGDVAGPVRVTGSDPHGLDADGDGVACES